MTDLEDTFGEEFAQNLNQKIAKRRERRYRVDDEMKDLIAHMAVNEEAFHGGEPHFTVSDEEGITHDVLLMDVPDPQSKSFFSMIRQLDSGAVTAPLNYLGEFMSTLWNDPDLVKELEPGQNYVVVGELDQWESDSGEVNDQLQPVRGAMNLEELQQRAQNYLDKQAEDAVGEGDDEAPDVVQQPSTEEPVRDPEQEYSEQQAPESEPDEEESESAEEEPVPEPDEEPEEEKSPRFRAPREEDIQSEAESEQAPSNADEESALADLASENQQDQQEGSAPARGISEDQVAAHIETLANKEPAVWEVEEGDPRLGKLAVVVTNRLGLDDEDDAVIEEVKNICIKRIEEERISQQEEAEDTDEEDNLF